MKEGRKSVGPQGSMLFRTVAFFSRLRLGYLLRNVERPFFVVAGFVFIEGAIALGIITAAAYLTSFPLLYPPLGPSAFIVFYTPMSESASPRNVVLSHFIAILIGFLSLYCVDLFVPQASLYDPEAMNLARVLVIALAMGCTSMAMAGLRCAHPPAAASALIVAMGFLGNYWQAIGLIAAVLLLVVEAFFFNRILGGLPYPLWRSDPKISRNYGMLAGIPGSTATYWQHMIGKLFHRRD